MENKNKVVLITGASRGIGSSTAHLFAEKGYDIVINYKDNKDLASNLKEVLETKYNNKVITFQADIANEEKINEMLDTTISTFGKIDVLVNNAAISIDTTFEDKTKENFMKILEVNLVGAFILSKKVVSIMKKQGSGTIIFVSSTNASDTFYPESLDYDASKAGLDSLMKNLSVICAPNIRVNTIAPGWVDTSMSNDLDTSFYKEQIKPILLNRFAKPKEIASVITFLASEEASYINGTIIRVDGGYHY